jgi:hypothetical protein
MSRGVTRQSLNKARHIYQPARVLVGLINARECLGLERRIERHPDCTRYQFCNRIYILIRIAEHSADIAHSCTCGKRSECNYLTNTITAVLFLDVTDDLLATLIAEIDIKVGHADALGIEKALKEKSVLQRIDIGYTDEKCYKTAGAGASARTGRYAVRLGIADKIKHDKKIFVVAHLMDYAELVLRAFDIILTRPALGKHDRARSNARLKPLHRQPTQIVIRIAAVLRHISRQVCR